MSKYYDNKVVYRNGEMILPKNNDNLDNLSDSTIAYQILSKHNFSENRKSLQLKFDALASHDITYVGIIQSALASGLKKFPIPYVLTNCHNSLCAVGGTINSDDHNFGLSAVKKFGGEFVPAHIGVIHQYMREMYAGCGKMILGSDSHTRYGALGTVAIGEGGGELVKQLLSDTYNVSRPEVVAIHLTGVLPKHCGPMDVALSLIGLVYENGLVKNKILEFVGSGIETLSMDYRNAIDVMTTETACLSSIWETDEKTYDFLELHGRGEDYKKLVADNCMYDSYISINLSEIKPMIALPFHPSNVYEIEEVLKNPVPIFEKVNQNAKKLFENNKNIEFDLRDKIIDEGIMVTQAVIGGCAGGIYENVVGALEIIKALGVKNNELPLNVYPSSQAEYLELSRKGYVADLIFSGATVKTAICGPCFGAGDVPNYKGFSIRHNTRNFPNREGAKPSESQVASVALMDAKHISATYCNVGYLRSAEGVEVIELNKTRSFDKTIYDTKVINYIGKEDNSIELVFAPSIAPWPKLEAMTDNILLEVAAS
ncbi:MAG: hydratase, partial [Lachnospirales bacterium]